MPSDSRIYSEKQYQIYEQASKFRPFNIETLYNKALSHMHLSELDEVDWCYVEILKMYPIIAGAIGEKETIQLEKGNYKQAVIFFDKALKIELKNIRIIRNKALALELIGDQASAEKI
jgi:tetratricopeptide (TPR) repeat protein